MDLISKNNEINFDANNAFKRLKMPDDYSGKGSLGLFNDFGVEGDGSVYCDFKAKAIFDPTNKTQPFQILPQGKEIPMTSPIGFHKAVIADMDTDMQMKSKFFGNQMVIDDRLSLALQPTSFRNLTLKYQGQPGDTSFGADWFQIGSMELLSHKDAYKAKHKVLSEFAQKISEGKENPQSLKQKYILRMNQFNFNSQSFLSTVVGYVQPTNLDQPLSTTFWRTVQLSQPNNNGSPTWIFYMREVKDGDTTLGVLMDLNNLIQVNTVNNAWDIIYKMQITLAPNEGETQANTTVAFVSTQQIKKQCGLHFIPGLSL